MDRARRPSDTLRIVLRGTLEVYEQHVEQVPTDAQAQPMRVHRSYGVLAGIHCAREPIGEYRLEGGHVQPATLVGGKDGLLLALRGSDFRCSLDAGFDDVVQRDLDFLDS